MKKVELKKLDLTEFSNFISKLTPLNESGTIYFSMDNKSLFTDSHNDSKSIVKSIKKDLDIITGSHNITERIKFCFYDGKKVLKAFSFLNGNEVNCTVIYDTVDGEYFAQSVKVFTNRMSITLDAADPSLIEFANVPDEVIDELKSTAHADCNFNMTQGDVLQISKLLDFDNNTEIFIKVSNDVKIGSGSSFEISVDEEFTGLVNEKIYRIDKELFRLVDVSAYIVYPDFDNSRIIFNTHDKNTSIVVTLCEDVE